MAQETTEKATDLGWGFLYPKKDREGKQPTLTGKATLESGEEVELAAWTRESKDGVKYLRVHITPPYEADSTPDNDSDPLPF